MEAFDSMGKFSAIILAAGKGKRTGLSFSKVLIPLCGKPMLAWVVETIKALNPEQIIAVVSPDTMKKAPEILSEEVSLAVQEKPLGTGDALKCALKHLKKKTETLLVACGDTPLLSAEVFSDLLKHHHARKGAATVLTALISNPFGYGRIVRDKKGCISKITEEKDAENRIKRIKEINSGTYCFEYGRLMEALPALSRNNKQKEYYLTDCVAWMAGKRQKVVPFLIEDPQAALGVNTLKELSFAQKVLNDRLKEKWLNSGVIFSDYDSVQLESDVVIGPETILYPFLFLQNGTRIGSGCKIGPFTRIAASQIGNDVVVQSSVLQGAFADDDCRIGPFAYLRPGTRLQKGVKVGDFVEVKNSTIGLRSKVPHLSYVGDATIGQDVNIGAGVITCNYDGKGKYPTIIEDGAFIGSNTNLRAPVRIGKNAVTGAGSVVTKDVEPGDVVAGVPAKIIKKREDHHGG